MENKEKELIAQELRMYVNRIGGQNKAANSLKKVSPASVSQILNDKWDKISDDMWRNIASQVSAGDTDRANEWKEVETANFRQISQWLDNARECHITKYVTGDAGTGKTFALKRYASTRKNTYLLCCNEFWNRKTLFTKLLAAMGRRNTGYNKSFLWLGKGRTF